MIYFLKRENGDIKIGRSICVKTRKNLLEREVGEKLILLKEIRGGSKKEKSLHDRFKHLCVGGEWFNGEELIDYIISLSSEHPELNYLPRLQRIFALVGDNIRKSRIRRAVTQDTLCDRAGVSRSTLVKIEHGSPSVKFGSYATVLFALGLERDLKKIAEDLTLKSKLKEVDELRKRIRSEDDRLRRKNHSEEYLTKLENNR